MKAAQPCKVFFTARVVLSMTLRCLCGRRLWNFVGDGRLTKFGVRFLRQVWPGDTLTGTAEITAIREENGVPLADLTVTTVNQNDAPVVTGTATARLDA